MKFVRSIRGDTASYEGMITEIKDFISSDFVRELKAQGMVYEQNDYHMAEIPDFGAMLQKANELGVPVFALKDNEIPGGASFANTTAKRDEIKNMFSLIADAILENVV